MWFISDILRTELWGAGCSTQLTLMCCHSIFALPSSHRRGAGEKVSGWRWDWSLDLLELRTTTSMAPSKASQPNGEKKGLCWLDKTLGGFFVWIISGKGRPKGSVKKPKQPKQTKAKVKAAAKKSKEPKNTKTAANWEL